MEESQEKCCMIVATVQITVPYSSIKEIFKAQQNNLVEEISKTQWNSYRSLQREREKYFLQYIIRA